MWVHARQGDGGCIVHSENVAGELWKEETELEHESYGFGEGFWSSTEEGD